ncbi:MAG: hypothetical protein ACKN9T_18230 [Candidatus Methylumidiphilus sp.]
MSRLANFCIGMVMEQIPVEARGNTAICLAVWLGNVANGQRRTVAFKLDEAAQDLGVDYFTVQRWWAELQKYEGVFVCGVENHARRGVFARLGKAYRQANEVTHMAVSVYCKVFGVARPDAEGRELIVKAVGDEVTMLKQWRGMCERWQQDGYNPLNIEGLLEAWRKRQVLREGFGGKGQEPRAKRQELRTKKQEPSYNELEY